MSDFRFVMLSAGFEHGGNVTHRHFDGHPDLLVYPFESQLGYRFYNDFLASLERVQYRYPEFPEGFSARRLYEEFFDEEMKTYLRKREGSKFHAANLVMDEKNRIAAFEKRIGPGPDYKRKQAVEAFFRSTFDAWENYYVTPKDDMVYVGYCPAIGLDAERMIHDFPNIKILHIVRNPFSAYRDTKRRPFPLPLDRYLITWNIYHSTASMYAGMYPENVKVVRYEDLVADKKAFMTEACEFIGIPFSENLLYPSWNGEEIKENIAPWGTVLRSTEDYNRQMIDELEPAEQRQIKLGTAAVARHLGYDNISYLKEFYAE